MSGGSFNPLSILGAVGGAASSGNTSTTVNRDPWAPAQPYLLANIDSASRLQNQYQNNPLSALQQRAYTNSFTGSDNARQGLSALSTQLGGQGWSRNSGPRLPQGYNFLPLGVTGGGVSGGGTMSGGLTSGGGLLGGLPTNSFTGGGIVSNTPAAYKIQPKPYEGGNDGSGGTNGGYGGTSPTGSFLGDMTLAANSGLFGLPGLLLGKIALNSVTNSVADKSAQDRAAAIAADPSFGGGGYTGPGGTTAPTGGGVIGFAANPMAPDPATVQGQTIANAGGASVSDGGPAPGSVSGQSIGGVSIGALGDPASTAAASVDGGGGGGGGDKIICTAMNEAYGFGSYRQAIWLKYSERMTKEHERGYHKLFLPLVKYAFHSGDGFGKRIVRAVLEHGARHRTADLRAEMYGRKRDTLGRIYRAIFEPMCYVAGKA